MKIINNQKNILIIIVAVMCFLFISLPKTQAQEPKETDLTDNLVHYLGLYVFNLPNCSKPVMFEKIRWISIKEFPNQDIDNPKTDAQGYTKITGYIETIDDERFKFRKATLKKNKAGNYEEFEFETKKINGIYYTFSGKFLDDEVQEKEGGSYTKMRGRLYKYRKGKLFAITDELVPFSEYAIL